MPRFTIDIDEKFAKVLEDLANAKNTTKAEAVRQAVLAYAFLKREVDGKPDSKISITNSKDKVMKDVFLP